MPTVAFRKCPFCDSGLNWTACSCRWAIEAQRHGMIPTQKRYIAQLYEEAGTPGLSKRPLGPAPKRKKTEPAPRAAPPPRPQPATVERPAPPAPPPAPPPSTAVTILPPAGIPAIPDDQWPMARGSRLPIKYDEAKTQIAALEDLDLCGIWVRQFETLAIYASRARYPQIAADAQRIRLEALRHAGELLKRIPVARPGTKKVNYVTPPLPNSQTRGRASQKAGFSTRQRRDAERIAEVPRTDFEREISRERPPPVEELAKLGTKPDNKSTPPESGFVRAYRQAAKLVEGANPDEFATLSDQSKDDARAALARLEAAVGRAALLIRGG